MLCVVVCQRARGVWRQAKECREASGEKEARSACVECRRCSGKDGVLSRKPRFGTTTPPGPGITTPRQF
jgi:hypothetical protein